MGEKIELPEKIIVQALRDAGQVGESLTGRKEQSLDKFVLASVAAQFTCFYVLGQKAERGEDPHVSLQEGEQIMKLIGDYLVEQGVLKPKDQTPGSFGGKWVDPDES